MQKCPVYAVWRRVGRAFLFENSAHFTKTDFLWKSRLQMVF